MNQWSVQMRQLILAAMVLVSAFGVLPTVAQAGESSKKCSIKASGAKGLVKVTVRIIDVVKDDRSLTSCTTAGKIVRKTIKKKSETTFVVKGFSCTQTFQDMLVSYVSCEHRSADVPTESICFNFTAIRIDYKIPK